MASFVKKYLILHIKELIFRSALSMSPLTTNGFRIQILIIHGWQSPDHIMEPSVHSADLKMFQP